MRVLVEQTESEVRAALMRLGMLWDEQGAHEGRVGVHLLMGGAGAGKWHLHPEADAVLVGTQDMLPSRGMNRGYGCGRARWPMEFGLLNQDALWVMDEVQLMDVGLAASGQLQVFRDAEHQAERMMVVEAGVDLSASLLVTELAPWASLVQRFGRCARWGGRSDVVIADLGHENDKQAAPYTLDELTAALAACQRLPDVAPSHLERFEDQHEELLTGLYPYDPKHLLLRHELDELFDTTADLSGADVDVSRFIRSGDERDIRVFWAQIDTGATPPDDLKPARSELLQRSLSQGPRLVV